jgi:hypothetical protein
MVFPSKELAKLKSLLLAGLRVDQIAELMPQKTLKQLKRKHRTLITKSTLRLTAEEQA